MKPARTPSTGSGMPPPSASQSTTRVLLLTDDTSGHRASDALVRSADADVRRVNSVADALSALRTGDFDAFVSSAGAVAALLDGAEQRGADALKRVEIGVCVVTRAQRPAWINAALERESPEAIEAIVAVGARYLNDLANGLRPGESGARRSSLACGARHFDVTVSSLPDESGRVDRAVVVARDVTDERRRQERLAAIDAAGRALLNLDADALPDMDVGDRLALLQDRIVSYSHELLHFDHFAIRILDPSTRRLDTVLAGGFSEQAKSLEIRAEREGQGISGYVAATGESYICGDVHADPRYLPGIESARSSLTVPLILQDRVIGVLNVESERVGAFTEEDRQFAEIFARYVAIALQILRLLAGERRATTGQIAADVEAEIAKPMEEVIGGLNRIIAGQSGVAADASLVRGILASVDRLRASLNSIVRPRGITGLAPEHIERDPVLDGKRVLVADDEDIIRETISDVLTRKGAEIVTARDGNEAVTLLTNATFELVLSDIKMPGRNGYEVFAAARATRPDCPVILITGFGYDPNHSIVRASREGLAGVLFKPFKVDQLLERVRQALVGAGGG